jgi:DnaJ-class molecular chaperone
MTSQLHLEHIDTDERAAPMRELPEKLVENIQGLKTEKTILKFDVEKSRLYVKGKGIKELNGYSIGDQLVHVNIWTPKQLTSEESEILEKLRNSANFAPQPGKSDKGFFNKVKDMFS